MAYKKMGEAGVAAHFIIASVRGIGRHNFVQIRLADMFRFH